jgi:hypothetical protein
MNHLWTNFLNQNLTKKFEINSLEKLVNQYLILSNTPQFNSTLLSFDIYELDKKINSLIFKFNDINKANESITFENVSYFQTNKLIESNQDNGVIISNLGRFVPETGNKEISIQSQYSSETFDSQQSYAIRINLGGSTNNAYQIDLWFGISDDSYADIKLIFIRDYIKNSSNAYSVINSIN